MELVIGEYYYIRTCSVWPLEIVTERQPSVEPDGLDDSVVGHVQIMETSHGPSVRKIICPISA